MWTKSRRGCDASISGVVNFTIRRYYGWWSSWNETIHKKWNDSIAILSGDAMLVALLKLNEIPKYSSSIIKNSMT